MTTLRHVRAALAVACLLAPARAHAQRAAELQIAPPYMRMVQDAQAQLVATAYDSNGTPVNVRIRWFSSNINVATVAADGTVHGIMPGSALITAIAEQDGRRVLTRASVYVTRPRPPGITVTLPPDAPGQAAPTPPSGPAPGTPFPARPPMTMVRIDSLARASINCAEPFMNAANPMRACYDTPPIVRDSSFVPPEQPTRERCPQGGGSLMLLVQVNDEGRVDGVMPFTSSACGDWIRASVEAARRAIFTPATQNGQPVRAWVRLHVRGEESLR